MKEPTSRRLRQSGIYRNPALTYGQKLYLLDKCRVSGKEIPKDLIHVLFFAIFKNLDL